MGANFVATRFDGELTEYELKQAFYALQDEDRYENGHSYSGGLGMCEGIKIINKQFNSEDKVREYIEENAQKWEEALAIKHKDKWIVGGWCSC